MDLKKFRIANLSDRVDFRSSPSQLCLPGKLSSRVLHPGDSIIVSQADLTKQFLLFVRKNAWIEMKEITSAVKEVVEEKATTEELSPKVTVEVPEQKEEKPRKKREKAEGKVEDVSVEEKVSVDSEVVEVVEEKKAE